jgi:hypothetical protein
LENKYLQYIKLRPTKEEAAATISAENSESGEMTCMEFVAKLEACSTDHTLPLKRKVLSDEVSASTEPKELPISSQPHQQNDVIMTVDMQSEHVVEKSKKKNLCGVPNCLKFSQGVFQILLMMCLLRYY